MRFNAFLLTLLFAVGAPALCAGDVLYLKDGSSLHGTMVKFERDTLYFDTSFGGRVVIPRKKIVRVELVEGPVPSAGGGADRAPVVSPGLVPAKPGTLIVDFGDTKISSTISVHRDRDRAGHVRENTIEAVLYVDGKRVAAVADSTTDKKIMKGVEVLLRNRMEPGVLRVVLDPGAHRVSIAVANTRVRKYGDRFVGAPLSKRLNVDDVEIRPGETRRLYVELKRKKFGLSRSILQTKDSSE